MLYTCAHMCLCGSVCCMCMCECTHISYEGGCQELSSVCPPPYSLRQALSIKCRAHGYSLASQLALRILCLPPEAVITSNCHTCLTFTCILGGLKCCSSRLHGKHFNHSAFLMFVHTSPRTVSHSRSHGPRVASNPYAVEDDLPLQIPKCWDSYWTLNIELGASCMLSKHYTMSSTPTS